VAGLLGSRDFLNGLAFRVFFSTQYLRHHSAPFYTPEPDLVHELIGHAPMFADAAFADLSQEIGLASLGASDDDIERLARCYWYSVEFGVLREDGAVKAYGAGLLSSSGELAYACDPASTPGRARPKMLPWRPDKAAAQFYPITEYQPAYFVAESLQDAKARMQTFCRARSRPFHARFNPAADAVWVDRAVRRNA
jgi:phenylalanine-4-hydroxylase